MSARPWHKRYHSDALSGMMVLTLEERGAYQTILDLIYDRAGPLPDNDGLLARYMGVSIRKWKAIRQSLIGHGKIRVEAGSLINDRAISEVENAAKTSRKHAENGAKGGRKKHENAKNGNDYNENEENWLAEKPSIPEARSQKPEEVEDKPLPQGAEDFAFVGRTIRLRQSDFDTWQRAFHAIPDLAAELVSLDAWFDGPGSAKRKDWFQVVAGSLAKKHQAYLREDREPEEAGGPSFTGFC